MSSPSMSNRFVFPDDDDGPVPPSPYAVDTPPEYFSGQPTPPPSPPRTPRATDDYAPCPPTPYCVPREGEAECACVSNSRISGASSAPHVDQFIPRFDHATTVKDPITGRPLINPWDQPRYVDEMVNPMFPHVSDQLIYAHDTYACPSPVMIMIQRATLDRMGLGHQPVIPSTCSKPLQLFSLTAGYIPKTGLNDCDDQSLVYYALRPSLSPRTFDPHLYRFFMGTIEGVQDSLRTDWSLVFPSPIPAVIIRSRDIIGPRALSPRVDGFAFVAPAQDSIWPIVCQRGVDSSFRPLDPSATVNTDTYRKGEAIYWPQHIVAAKFAVNVFVEVETPGTGQEPRCDYLGAYVMQAMDNLTIHSSVWANVAPQVQRSVSDRVPYRFQGRPWVPYVWFHYYKWDIHIIGLADEVFRREILDESDSDESVHTSDSGFDTDEGSTTTFSEYSPVGSPSA